MIDLSKDFYDEEVRYDFTITNKTKRIWAIELELLIEFDRICKKYDLKYFLAYGTLIGAAREKGFIPWDTDVDVVMMRRDYHKFCKIAREEVKTPYSFRDGHCDYAVATFANLLKDGTTAVCVQDAPPEQHQGIYIDIFPLDSVPDGSNDMNENGKKCSSTG